MDAQQIRSHVARLFPESGPHSARSARIAVEHELVTTDASTGLPASIDRIREATTHGWYVDHLDAARDIFVATALDDEFVDFLTLPAYAEVVGAGE